MGLFYYIVLHCIVFDDVNLTISPLDRPITAEFTEFSMKTSLINILCLHKFQITIIIFTNNLTNNRYVSTNDPLNSRTNHFIDNSINDRDLPNSDTSPLSGQLDKACAIVA